MRYVYIFNKMKHELIDLLKINYGIKWYIFTRNEDINLDINNA